jgi:hypothetical protein
MRDGIIFVPWYKSDDYYRFRRMNGGANMPSSYDDWLGKAVQEVSKLLATGKAVQLVCLTPATYFEWLTRRCAADTGEERLAYLCDMTARSGCAERHDTLATFARQAHTHH